MEKFGERIRKLRQERGLTTHEMAEKLGISRNTLTNWERGTKEIYGIKLLEEMAEILEVPLKILLSGEKEISVENNPVIKNLSLGNILNEVSQTEEKIVSIDIENLESNPQNFYGLRDIDSLAALISVSHLVEPLTVSAKCDGKYTIISGHRRRAAVQKLLDDGVYDERKLPCIVKKCKKIQIEQEDGEIVEFDKEAVEMLNLIASNRGQREERTVDEKLQEVRYLEKFAKAIYHQKDRGKRGRFRSFFAEEILNISKSQLQRINAMEKLTDKVKQAIDDKKLSESAAAREMANMTAEEQDACLEKILSGEIRGTMQDIQAQKTTDNIVDENSAEVSEDDSFAEEIAEKFETNL